MNIIMITKVKNEADIIEYFLRYHANIFDHIIVIENGSLDGTFEIIKSLINEGLPIDLINEAYEDFDAFRMVNQYTKRMVKKYKADYVAFMDADELLVASDGSEPRNIICKLKDNAVHCFNWKTYLYSRDIDIFSLESFDEYRDEEYESFTKIIVPGKLILENDIVIEAGNHTCHMASTIKGILREEYHDELKFLHFPIRSSLQYKKQMCLNTIDMISNPLIQNHTGGHWKQMIFANGYAPSDLRDISLHYAYYLGDIIIKKDIRINYEIQLKYSDLIEKNIEIILMKHSEAQSLRINRLRRNQNSVTSLNKKIAVWGTGELSKKMIGRISKLYEIQVFVDMDPNKEFSEFANKLVVPPRVLRFIDFEMLIIASDKYEEEIRKHINTMFPYIDEKNVLTIEELVLNSYA